MVLSDRWYEQLEDPEPHNANRRGSNGPCDCDECRGLTCASCGGYPDRPEERTCPGCALVVCQECQGEHRLECRGGEKGD
jgi:hypothetical protein